MPRAHTPITIDELKGQFYRPDYPVPPIGYGEFTDVVFQTNGIVNSWAKVFTRPPYQVYPANFPTNVTVDGGPVRFHKYRKLTDNQDYWIILSAAGKFYDTGAAVPNNPILTLTPATAPDFSLITIGQRCIFSPHNRDQGIVGEFTYIYERGVTTTARKLAGAKPVGVFTVAVSATNGNTEPGLHIIAVAYEFNTGFITRPALYQQLTAPAGVRKAIDLSAIPVGPAGVVARRILMTRKVANFDGNNENPELFFALKINDNVTVALLAAISMFDTQLIQSADYLKDNLEEVPAMLCFSYYERSLVCAGAGIEKSVVRVSKGGDYETFDATDGFVVCAPFEGDGVRNLRAARGSLYMFKRHRSLVTRNNGESPSSWPVDLVDSGLGAEVFSIAEVGDGIIGSINNAFLIANLAGVWLFDNGFVDLLSWPVQGYWSFVGLGPQLINTVVAVYDQLNRCFIMNMQTGNLGQPHFWSLLYADLSNGFSKNAVKWSVWSRSSAGAANVVFKGMHLGTRSDGYPEVVIAADLYSSFHTINLREYAYAVLGQESDNFRDPAISLTLESENFEPWHWAGVRFVFAPLVGSVTSETHVESEVASVNRPSNERYYLMKDNVINKLYTFMLRGTRPADKLTPVYFTLYKCIVFAKPLWSEEPQ